MTLPDPLETVTVRGFWASPVTGAGLVGSATLRAVNEARSPVGDVLLTTSPEPRFLDDGVAEWVDVLCSDSAELSNPITYQLEVTAAGYHRRRLIELNKADATDGVIQLADVDTVSAPPSFTAYVPLGTVGHPGGPAGPLGADGTMPPDQLSTGIQAALDGKPPRVQITDPMTKYGLVAATGRSHEFMGSGGFAGQFVIARIFVPAGVGFSRMAIPIRAAGTFTAGSGKPNQLAWWDDDGVLQQVTPNDDHMWDVADWYVANLPAPVPAQAADRYVYGGLQISGVAGAGQYVLTGAFDGGGVPFAHAPGSAQRFCAYAAAVAVLGDFDPTTVGTLTTFMPFIGFLA
jgi:hypothetical protein